MSYQITKPSPVLSPYVRHYWTLSGCSSGKPHLQRIVPSGLNEVNFYFNDLPYCDDPDFSVSETSMVSGHLNRYYDLEIRGNPGLFSVVFEPQGLFRLLGIRAHELFNRNIPLKYVLGKEVEVLESMLYEAQSFESRIKIMDRYLMTKLRNSEGKQHVDRIGYISDLIRKRRAKVEIQELASTACFSRKQFERIFSEQIGISPKRFLKTIRFQYSVYEKSMNPECTLTELSYLSGYYDQSHMIHDFLSLTGMTPRQYFSACEPFSDFFLS